MEDNELKLSKFNTGVAIVMRLNGLWDGCNKAYNNAEFSKWNSLLDTLYLETSDDEDEEDSKKYNRINWFITKNPDNPYWIRQKHIFIKQLHKKQGVGKKYIDEDEFDFA